MVPHGTKITWYLIAPSWFNIIPICTISTPTYHPLRVDKAPKYVFVEPQFISTTNLIHHKRFVAIINMMILESWFNSDQNLDTKIWYYGSHSCNLFCLMVHKLQVEPDFVSMKFYHILFIEGHALISDQNHVFTISIIYPTHQLVFIFKFWLYIYKCLPN